MSQQRKNELLGPCLCVYLLASSSYAYGRTLLSTSSLISRSLQPFQTLWKQMYTSSKQACPHPFLPIYNLIASSKAIALPLIYALNILLKAVFPSFGPTLVPTLNQSLIWLESLLSPHFLVCLCFLLQSCHQCYLSGGPPVIGNFPPFLETKKILQHMQTIATSF